MSVEEGGKWEGRGDGEGSIVYRFRKGMEFESKEMLRYGWQGWKREKIVRNREK